MILFKVFACEISVCIKYKLPLSSLCCMKTVWSLSQISFVFTINVKNKKQTARQGDGWEEGCELELTHGPHSLLPTGPTNPLGLRGKPFGVSKGMGGLGIEYLISLSQRRGWVGGRCTGTETKLKPQPRVRAEV